jgi:hypothetical protein
MHALGVELRTGIHTGECELLGDKIAGIAVPHECSDLSRRRAE